MVGSGRPTLSCIRAHDCYLQNQLGCHGPTGSPCSTVGAWGGAYRAARSKARPRPSANANCVINFRRLERLPTKGIGVLLGVRLGSLRYRAAVPEVGPSHTTNRMGGTLRQSQGLRATANRNRQPHGCMFIVSSIVHNHVCGLSCVS